MSESVLFWTVQNTEIDWFAKVDGPEIKTYMIFFRWNWFVVQDICSNHLNGTSKWLAEVPPRSWIFESAKSGTLTQALTLRVLVYWFSKKKTHVEYLKMIACKDNPTDQLNRTSKFDQRSIPKWSDVVHQKCTREGHEPTVLMSVWLNNYIL